MWAGLKFRKPTNRDVGVSQNRGSPKMVASLQTNADKGTLKWHSMFLLASGIPASPRTSQRRLRFDGAGRSDPQEVPTRPCFATAYLTVHG